MPPKPGVPPEERFVPNPFLFRLAGKHLLFGSAHHLPPSAFPLEIRHLLANCDIYHPEYVDDTLPEQEEPGPGVLSLNHLIEVATHMARQLSKTEDWPQENVPDLQRLGLKWVEEGLGKQGKNITDYDPRIFLSFLTFAQAFNEDYVKEFESKKATICLESNGLDESLDCYFASIRGNTLVGLETYFDRLLLMGLNHKTISQLDSQVKALSQQPLEKVMESIEAQLALFDKTSRARAECYKRVLGPFTLSQETQLEIGMRLLQDGPPAASANSAVFVGTLRDAYFAGDATRLQNTWESLVSDVEREVYRRRDENFAARIDALMHKEGGENQLLFNVGAGHLFGPHSILANLQSRGMPIERYSLHHHRFDVFSQRWC